jgi:hypothetical protein
MADFAIIIIINKGNDIAIKLSNNYETIYTISKSTKIL